MSTSGHKSNLFWLTILAVILLVSLAASAVYLMVARGESAVAVIKQDGRELYRIDLTQVKEPYTLEIAGKHENTVTVEPGRICVSHATCPDKICVERGWISERGVPIVCLPNALVIEIEGGDGELDATTG